ncbi:MAG: peptide chain release factor N(5)-glutamine methyltransferase [SAR86 cluster bacterium]|nr:peptide chain release factor N(5)-glutamine methyltransferase [SAR86 cluster bacterium]
MPASLNTYKEKIRQLEISFPGISNNFRFFLKKALKYSDSIIVLNDDFDILDHEMEIIEGFIESSKNKIPIEYILHEAEFYGRNFYVDNRVLIPRDETELLIDILKNYDQKKDLKVVDLGTGSGCIAISIALEIPKSIVLGVDKYLDALNVATKNKHIHQVTNFHVKQSDWLSDINVYDFDVVISNPPYIDPTDKHLKDLIHEPKNALIAADRGLSDIKKISIQAYKKLKIGGILMFEHGFNQADEVKKIMELSNFHEIENFKDYQLHPRITIGKKLA